MKFDTKNWKKIKGEKDHSVLRNTEGHEMKISHAALSPKVRGELAAMPVHNTAPSKKNTAAKAPKMLAEGGSPEDAPASDQTPQAPVTINIGQPAAAEAPPPVDPAVTRQMQQNPGMSMGDAMAANAMSRQKYDQAQAAPQAAHDAAMASLPKTPQDAIAAPPQASAPTQATPPAQGPSPASSGPSLGAQTQLPPQGQGLDIMAAYDKGLQGINTQATAEQAIAKDQAVIQQKNAEAQAQLNQHFEEVSKASDDEYQKLVKDYADHPVIANRVWADKSTAGKISTSIGLILGGIGGGLLGQENPALKNLNMQIDRDVDAQKANLGRTQNLLSANYQHFHNLKDAADATRIGLASIAASELQGAALKQGGPLAKAKAQQATSDLMAKYYPLKRDLDMRTAVQNFASQPGAQGNDQRTGAMLSYLRVVNPKMAEEMEGRYVPQVGMASIPVPQAAREEITKKSNLIQATQNLKQWVAKNGGSANPKTRAEGQTLALELQQLYRQGVGASTSEPEQQIIGQIVNSNPASFFHSFTTDPKLKALEHSITSSLNNVKKNYGLPVQAPPPETKTVNGITYVRGPDGKAVPIRK